MHRAFLTLALTGAAACGDTAPATAPLLRTEVPITSSYHAAGTIGTAPRCEALGLWHVQLEGSGIESHAGRYTIRNSHCLDPATGAFTAGRFTKIVASGDELRGTYRGTSSVLQPPAPIGIFAVDGLLEFTGGTGRFADASGSQRMAGRQTSDFSQPGIPTTIDLRMEGSITTVGSSR
jgi:hypothetical protein